MMQECQLPYGNDFIKFRFPPESNFKLLKRKPIKGIENPVEAIINSLRFPIGCSPLVEQIKEKDRVTIIVTDNTRACPDNILLPPLLSEIEKRVSSDNITIIVALGLHRPLNEEELVKKLGRSIVKKYRVINHDPEDTVNLGFTSRGTPVEINRLVIESDYRISTGFIEPHFFAGFSGGRKSILPGVASSRSIRTNHGYEMIDHPKARAGVLEGNPIHEDAVEQAKKAGLNFILNVLLNDKHEITHVFAGDMIEAHKKGCEIESEIAGIEVQNKFDVVITTNSGAPLDCDFYQTCKGIENASRITREGGIIIIAAACTSGIGPESFYNLHASAVSPQSVLHNIQVEGPFGVQWQNQILARVQLVNQIYLVSELDADLVKKMMVVPILSVEEGLKLAKKVLGKNTDIAIIPEGPLVLPSLREKKPYDNQK